MEHKPIDKYKVELKEISLESEEVFKRIKCPACHNNVPADNININDKIAKCNTCDVVFPFEKEIENFITPQSIKQEVIRPEGIDIFRFRNELDISIQQPFLVREIIAMAIVPLFAIAGTKLFANGKISFIWFAICWMITITPYLALFFRSKQRIHINIDSKYLYLEWRPKKLVKDKQYNVEEIHQIYTKTTTANGQQHHVYMIVNGKDGGQKHIPLIQNVGSLSKARYLEQEIEKHIGITDRQVPEESI